MPRGIRARRRYRSTWRSRTTRRRPMFVTSAPASTRTRWRLPGGGAAAVAGLGRESPDVVLLDVHMPAGGGRGVIEGVRADSAGGSATQFLALSVSDAAEDVIGIIRAGARGYVTKSISAAELVAAAQRVHGGDVVFSPRLAGFVLDAFAGEAPAPPPPAPAPLPSPGTDTSSPAGPRSGS